MSLKEALFLAYNYNPKMEEARKEIDALKGRRITEGAFKGPEVTFEIGGFKSEVVDGEKISPRKNLDSFEVIQPFDPPGVVFLKERIAHAEVKIGEGAFLRTWAGISKEVRSAFAGVLYSEEALNVFKSNLDAARQFRDRVEVKYQSSDASKSESLRASIEVLKAEEEFLEAEKESFTQKAKLNLLLARPFDSPLQLEGVLSYESADIRHKEILDEAISARSDLLNQKIRVDASEKAYLKSKLSFLPEPFVGFSRTREEFENDYSVILGARLPLWDFNVGEMKEKKALLEKEKIKLQALGLEIQDEIYRVTREVELAERRVKIQKKAIEEANELLREVTLQYEEGDVNFLVYLENLKVVKETRLSYFRSLKNYSEKLAELEEALQSAPRPEEEKK
ncbi:MAG: TolC family protein [Thermodesulfobacteriota bacterium]